MDLNAGGASSVVRGVVVKDVPLSLYLIKLEDGRQVRCSLAGPVKLSSVSLLEGDSVEVEVSRIDPGRGRIVAVGD